MNKTEKLIDLIYNSIKEKYDITEEIILTENGLNGKKELTKVTRKLIEDIKGGLIPNLKFEEDKSSDDLSCDIILELYPIGLHLLSKEDFEGSDCLSVNEMLKTASFYIFSNIKQNKVPKIKLSII